MIKASWEGFFKGAFLIFIGLAFANFLASQLKHRFKLPLAAV